MQRSRDQSVAFDFAGFGVGNADVIHVQSAPERSLVIGFGFLKVGQSAEFRALRGDQVALRQNDVVNRGRAKTIFLLLGVEGFLLKLAASVAASTWARSCVSAI